MKFILLCFFTISLTFSVSAQDTLLQEKIWTYEYSYKIKTYERSYETKRDFDSWLKFSTDGVFEGRYCCNFIMKSDINKTINTYIIDKENGIKISGPYTTKIACGGQGLCNEPFNTAYHYVIIGDTLILNCLDEIDLYFSLNRERK